MKLSPSNILACDNNNRRVLFIFKIVKHERNLSPSSRHHYYAKESSRRIKAFRETGCALSLAADSEQDELKYSENIQISSSI